MTDNQAMQAHPVAALFPMMGQDELEALAADIRAHGLHNPIVIHEGAILDGRNRFAACEMAGVVPSFVEWDGAGDPTAWVVSQNLHRRHLSESQRAMVAARLATLERGANQHAQICAPSQTEAAELLNVGRRSVQSARTVQEHGTPELVAAVDSGEVAVSRAAEIARLPEPEQAQALATARPKVVHNTGNNEWYTPAPIVEAARDCMGGIDCDPASCEQANETVGADTYYALADDGVTQPWIGRIWLNPPYAKGDIEPFCEALVEKFKVGEVKQACVLVNNGTETLWCQGLLAVCSAVCLIRGRVRFVGPDGAQGTPLQGQVAIYLGPVEGAGLFAAAFSVFGPVFRP